MGSHPDTQFMPPPNSQHEEIIFQPFKKFECVLKSKLEPYHKKIEALIEIWRSLGQCNEQKSGIAHIVQILNWAKYHTLNIVLTGKWKTYKDGFENQLLSAVANTKLELLKITDGFSKKFQKLDEVIRNPWDDPVLARLLQDKDCNIGDQEIEFFCVETAYLISVRLRKLCESQCEDLALNLVTAYLKCYHLSESNNFNLNVTHNHILFCLDIQIALLFLFQKMTDIIALFKRFSLEEGWQLVKRFSKKQVKICKVWRKYIEITFLAAQVFLTTAVTKPIDESGEWLKKILTTWVDFSIERKQGRKLEASVRKIVQTATAAQHIYVCCEIFHAKFGVEMRSFTIEMYIRALTTDMNNLESERSESEHEKVKQTTKRLAKGFCCLAKILQRLDASRECILTAFSLEPTLERLRSIEELARKSGFKVLDTGQIWECRLHAPALPSDELSWICNECGKWMTETKLDLRLTTNFTLNDALNSTTLGISTQLCDDLAVVLNGPRYQFFSWFLHWDQLHHLCEMYLNDIERTKNLVTELKFVDIDYSMFAKVKKEPIDDLAGIENGYEKYLLPDFVPDESPPSPLLLAGLSSPSSSSLNVSNDLLVQNQNDDVSMGGGCEALKISESDDSGFMQLISARKSDPETLKTLRMFRHTVKRNKPAQEAMGEEDNAKKCRIDDLEAEAPLGLNHFLLAQESESLEEDCQLDDEVKEIFLKPTSSGVESMETTMATLSSCSSRTESACSDLNINSSFYSVSSDYITKLKREVIANVFEAMRKSSFDDDDEHFLAQARTRYPSEIFDCYVDMKDAGLKSENSSASKNSVMSANLNEYMKFLKQTPSYAPKWRSVGGDGGASTSKEGGNGKNRNVNAEPCEMQKSNNESLMREDRLNHFFRSGDKPIIDEIDRFQLADENPVDCDLPPALYNFEKNPFSELRKLLEDPILNNMQKENSSKNANCCLPQTDQLNDKPTHEKAHNDNYQSKNAQKRAPVVVDNIAVPKSKKIDETMRKKDKRKKRQTKRQKSRKSDACADFMKNIKPKNCSSPIPKVCSKELRVVLNRLPSPIVRAYLDRPTASSPPPIRIVYKPELRYNNATNTYNIINYAVQPFRSGIIRKRARKPRRLKRTYNPSIAADRRIVHDMMNPRVLLERLDLDPRYVRSVLNNVPGLNDYQMMRPSVHAQIVNVVQVSGGRPTAPTGPAPATSTQISPHIQRIGQPRTDKPDTTTTEATSATQSQTVTTQTIKPTTSQPSTFINILSQQIIRPGQTIRNRTSPLINILSQQIIRPAQPKVASTQTADNSAQSEPTTSIAKTNPGKPGTILQFICKSALPKFQQAFGKTMPYEATAEATPPASSDTDKKSVKVAVTTQGVNIQPIQGGVIYTRQMPVGQTINLLPPGGRGQVFRIATTNSEQISLVKDTVIHSKMSALLAAALQGKQKPGEQADGVKPMIQIPTNVIRSSPQAQASSLSSTTLEQLREFDMVYKQIKERSSTSTGGDATGENEQQVVQQPAAVVVQAATVTPQAQPQQQRISVTYVNQAGQKFAQLSPVVVVSSYCNLQPAASPALSVTSQGSSSPCVTPAPVSTVVTAATKVVQTKSRGKTVSKTVATSSSTTTTTQASKSSPIPKPQQKPQEDEHTTQRIFDILAEYAEQLRNSPDLNNKPAPRRRSNPPTNPSQNSKRKKSSSSKKSGQCSSMASDADMEDHRTVGSEDSSCGVVQISMQDDEQAQAGANESNDSTSGGGIVVAAPAPVAAPRQQLILTDAHTSQTRNLIIADSSVGEALKMPNTAVLVPGNYIMPVSMVKGGQQIAVVSGGSKILATVPARSGPNMLLFQSFLNQNRNKSGGVLPTVKYSTIQPITGISSQTLAGVSGQPPVILPSSNLAAVTLGQPITLKKADEPERGNTELVLTITQPREIVTSVVTTATTTVTASVTPTVVQTHADSTNTITSTVANVEIEQERVIEHGFHEKVVVTAAPIATPVIAQTACVKDEMESTVPTNSIGLSIGSAADSKIEPAKSLERVQSVLVTACTSNGPMLAQTPPRYRKPSDSVVTNSESAAKEEFLHNGEKQNNNDPKQYQTNSTYFQTKPKKASHSSNPQRLDREIHQLCLQRKQAALERELRLQKSLSEECEDLGVDEPSTSDLFPEADILFDSNHSPSSFDQSSQEMPKQRQPDIAKDDPKAGMTLFSDDDNSGSLRADFLFESVEYRANELGYGQQLITNGQNSVTSNESMSDATCNSPLSPYNEATPPPSLNKYKFKYSNRRRGDAKAAEAGGGPPAVANEVSSSEDSSELGKACGRRGCCEEGARVSSSRSEDEDEDAECRGRGARRAVKKLCLCCNADAESAHKKAFANKKR